MVVVDSQVRNSRSPAQATHASYAWPLSHASETASQTASPGHVGAVGIGGSLASASGSCPAAADILSWPGSARSCSRRTTNKRTPNESLGPKVCGGESAASRDCVLDRLTDLSGLNWAGLDRIARYWIWLWSWNWIGWLERPTPSPTNQSC